MSLTQPDPLHPRPEEKTEPSDRPIGVTMLAVFYALSGVSTIVIQGVWLKRFAELSELLGFPAFLLNATLLVMGMVALAAAVGMWLGKRWGWWLSLFYIGYGIVRNGNALLSIPGIEEAYGVSADGATLKYAIRAAGYALVLLYFYGDAVTGYFFGIARVPKLKSAVIVFGSLIALFAVMTLTFA
ncbi:hypothetical protein [Paenibacillus flagellatus]|uniref:Uncharacterized protein n=1 Tax=Paenibacillus flagellatus TaxID=2211139 RepID=A0A2V5JXY1_9BACL|nr:hypothetical protein [Paenibacillus flagellatus]PYI51571.1 hypothetical protein DLM86_24465 [Paenibacillus flagellatus]